MITVKIIEDSINQNGDRLTTLQLHYPRLLHAELLTHRAFSKNARSSRAVPVKTLLKEEIFMPVFGVNIPGMQSREIMRGWKKHAAEMTWRVAASTCRTASRILMWLDVHKQHANRMLEWFGWIDVVLSSTEWENFFELRDHPDAQPEFQELAHKIRVELEGSKPRLLQRGQWHLPYILDEERTELPVSTLIKLSVARCARVSYKPFDGDPSIARESQRYDKLVGARPIHASPSEHQATPDITDTRNFRGWRQHRSFIEASIR